MAFQDLAEKGQVNGYAPLNSIGQVPINYLDSEVASQTDLSDHEAASDPHTGYQKESEKGVANGYAGLDGDGYVPAAQLPTDFYGWTTGGIGDIAATLGTIYSVPTGKSSSVSFLLVKNKVSTNQTVDIRINDGVSSVSAGTVTLAEGEYAIYADKSEGFWPLSDGSSVEAVATDATSVTYLILVQENG